MSEVDLIAETHRWSEEYKKQSARFEVLEKNLIEQRDAWKSRAERSEVEVLHRKLTDVELLKKILGPDKSGVIIERDLLKSENERLREAFIKYGWHKLPCPETYKNGNCSCGFKQALAATEGKAAE